MINELFSQVAAVKYPPHKPLSTLKAAFEMELLHGVGGESFSRERAELVVNDIVQKLQREAA